MSHFLIYVEMLILHYVLDFKGVQMLLELTILKIKIIVALIIVL